MNKSTFGVLWMAMMFPMGCATAVGETRPADTVLSIHVSKTGELTVTSAKDAPAEKCYVEPDRKPRCRGFDQNGEVLKVNPVTVFHTRGSNCAVVYGFGGIAYQVC